MNVVASKALPMVCGVLAALLVTTAITRHASAASNCDRTVTRTWVFPPGAWKYTDSGCSGDCPVPPQGNTCYDSFPIGLGNQPHYCACSLTLPPAPCTKVVYHPINIPYPASGQWTPAPTCINSGCLTDCDPVWTPIHGDPQTLTCPCP